MDPEASHHLAMCALEAFCFFPGKAVLREIFAFKDPSLETRALGLNFPSPVGLAAGFDKDARHVSALAALGFGFIEAGTVTFHAQPGNPKPRIKRIPGQGALWNHMGFNNEGAAAMAGRLKRERFEVPLGINLGKSRMTPLENAAEDYVSSFEALFPFGDYFVINVSSPNTPGLRKLQEKEALLGIISKLQSKNQELARKDGVKKKPVLVKVSPDLTLEALDDLLSTALDSGIEGLIATNTTLSRENVTTPLPDEGGVSGYPLRKRSTEFIRYIYKGAGKKIIVIGSGGIFSGADAWEKIKAGASLVQLYTGLIYEGPGLVKKIKKDLAGILKQEGIKSLSEAVGTAA